MSVSSASASGAPQPARQQKEFPRIAKTDSNPETSQVQVAPGQLAAERATVGSLFNEQDFFKVFDAISAPSTRRNGEPMILPSELGGSEKTFLEFVSMIVNREVPLVEIADKLGSATLSERNVDAAKFSKDIATLTKLGRGERSDGFASTIESVKTDPVFHVMSVLLIARRESKVQASASEYKGKMLGRLTAINNLCNS